MSEIRTASFFDAMKSAFANPREWWWRDTAFGVRHYLSVDHGQLIREMGLRFVVVYDDLSATWTCNGSKP